MKNLTLAFLLCSLVILISCSKDDNPTPASSLEGNYKFLSLSAKTNATQRYTVDGVTYSDVNLSDYSSINPAGTFTLTSNQFNTNGFAYDIDDEFIYYAYENGVKVDSIIFPFQFSFPPTTSTTTYTIVGTDSITFANGGLFATSDIDKIQGGRWKVDGDKLTITFRAAQDSSYIESGVLFNVSQSANGEIKLQKQ